MIEHINIKKDQFYRTQIYLFIQRKITYEYFNTPKGKSLKRVEKEIPRKKKTKLG